MSQKILLVIFSLLAGPFAEASDTYAFCQVKLLKAATDGLVQEFAEKGKQVGDIREIVYNYGLKGRPRVIFLSRHMKDPDEVCFVSVETHAPDFVGVGECPDYKFHHVHTTCN